MITEEQIAQAEADAAAAEQTRAQAEADYARGPARADIYRNLNDAVLAASHAAARARTLRAEQLEQAARLKARTEAEQAVAKGLASTVKKLNASRDRAVQAIAAAEKAAQLALAAVNEYDRLVRGAASDLRAHGLCLEEGGETGGGRDGSLRVSGDDWRPVDGPSLLDTVQRSVVAAANPRHPLARGVRLTYGGPGASRGCDALLSRLPR